MYSLNSGWEPNEPQLHGSSRPSAARSHAMSASHSRAADLISVSSTVCRSKVERLITFSTSAVAVCCWSDSAQLAEQPRVLDGDDGLRGEVLHQIDLLVGEGTHLLAVDEDRADQLVLFQHRHGDHASARRASWPAGPRTSLGSVVDDVNHRFGLQHAVERVSSRRARTLRAFAGIRQAPAAHSAWPLDGTCRRRSGAGCRT